MAENDTQRRIDDEYLIAIEQYGSWSTDDRTGRAFCRAGCGSYPAKGHNDNCLFKILCDEIRRLRADRAAPVAQENEVTVHWGYLVADICNLAKPNSPHRERAALLKQSLERIARLKQLTVSDVIRQAQRETDDALTKLRAHEEAEASVCPEDVSCIEYIKYLKGKLGADA